MGVEWAGFSWKSAKVYGEDHLRRPRHRAGFEGAYISEAQRATSPGRAATSASASPAAATGSANVMAPASFSPAELLQAPGRDDDGALDAVWRSVLGAEHFVLENLRYAHYEMKKFGGALALLCVPLFAGVEQYG